MSSDRGPETRALIPQISTSIEAPDSEEDVMTVEEENAALRYFSKETGGKIHRLSSLDVYLLQEKSIDPGESFLLNRRRSLRIEEEEVKEMNESFEVKEQEEKKRQIKETKEQIKEERERKKREREVILKKKHELEQKIFNRRKRKGLGGLSREKRNRLKQLIMQKAHEEMISERKRCETEKKNAIENSIPKLALDDLNEEELAKKCQEFHQIVSRLESEKYDIELKVNRQENELIELTRKITELPGKYSMPILKKVSKRESRFDKLLRISGRAKSVDIDSFSDSKNSSLEPMPKIKESKET